MCHAPILTSAGVISYDKLIEKVRDLEEYISEHGGKENESLDPAERMSQWLNSALKDEETMQ